MIALTGAGRMVGRGFVADVGVRGCTLLKSAKREGRIATWRVVRGHGVKLGPMRM